MTPRDLSERMDDLHRRQDAMCMFFYGSTLNGGNITIEPTPDSWCGRMQKIPQAVNRIMATWLALMTLLIAVMAWIEKR